MWSLTHSLTQWDKHAELLLMPLTRLSRMETGRMGENS